MTDEGDSDAPTQGKRTHRPRRNQARTRPVEPGSGSGSERSRPGGKRHQARIVALQILFEVAVTEHPVAEVFAHAAAEQELPPPVRDYAERLVNGTLGARERIDPYITRAAPAFPIAQLPAVDRNVLRLAIYELLEERDVPPKAAINEAVELAKRFGGDNSGRFVNGVLGTVVEQIAAT